MRLFAQWLHNLDPSHEIPPQGLIPNRSRRPRPYIYSEEEIGKIVAAAAALPSVYGMRGLTFSTLFSLIAMTGLRISEALGLDVVANATLYLASDAAKFITGIEMPVDGGRTI